MITPERQHHILVGEQVADGGYSGGHAYPGNPRKDVFPQSWSDDQILDAIAEVATNPAARWVEKPRNDYDRHNRPNRGHLIGTYYGVEIKVVYEPLRTGSSPPTPQSSS